MTNPYINDVKVKKVKEEIVFTIKLDLAIYDPNTLKLKSSVENQYEVKAKLNENKYIFSIFYTEINKHIIDILINDNYVQVESIYRLLDIDNPFPIHHPAIKIQSPHRLTVYNCSVQPWVFIELL